MNEIAGWLTLGTKLDNKNLNKQLSDQKKQLEKYAREQEKLIEQKDQSQADLKPYEDEIKALEELIAKREELAKVQTENGKTKASAGIEILQLRDKLSEANAKYTEQKALHDEIEQKISRNKERVAALNEEISKTESKLKKSKGWDDVRESIEGSSKSLGEMIKKVGRYAIAILGIRTAYSAIRSAMSTISQYDKQMATDIEYIRYTLAMTLKPVIEWLLKAIVKLLQYVNYLAQAWFGVTLFSSKSAKDFQNARNNLYYANKEAKKLKKTLAGFDEINILNKQDGESGMLAPSFELGSLSDLEDKDVPQWLVDIKNIGIWIKDNWVEVIGILLGTVGAIMVLNSLIGTTGGLGILGLATALASISLLIASLTYMIESLTSSGKDFNDILSVLAVVFGSIIALMAAIALLGPAMTAGLLPFSILMVEISAILIVMALTIPTILDAAGNFIVKIGPTLVKIIQEICAGIGLIIDIIGISLVNVIKEVGGLFDKIFKGIANVINSIGNSMVKVLNAIGNLVDKVLTSILNFIKELGPSINIFVDNTIKAVTKLINFMISGIEYLVNTLVVDGINSIIKGVNKIGQYVGFTIKTVPKFEIPRFVPKLATGGIVDVPKTGVNIGGAIAGEKGREAVLPLTNPNTMSELGKELAKWVTINIDLTNTIDGRVLNKRLEQINANSNFARNGVK